MVTKRLGFHYELGCSWNNYRRDDSRGGVVSKSAAESWAGAVARRISNRIVVDRFEHADAVDLLNTVVMALGIPLPNIETTPARPFPSSVRPVAPDADVFRDALYDARRELFRARGAIFGNEIFGGFSCKIGPVASTLVISSGVAQLMVPRSSWSATPSSTKLYVPVPLAGGGTDGAFRVEKPASSISVGNGTTGPIDGHDHIIYLTYDETSQERSRYAWKQVDTGASIDWTSAVPIAWVRIAGGVFTLVRSIRWTPPWRPRITQMRFPEPWYEFSGASGGLIPGTDIGSYWLQAGMAVRFTLGVQLTGSLDAKVVRAARCTLHISRGDAADNFAQPHFWYGATAGQTPVPSLQCAFPVVGRTWINGDVLFVPREEDVPAIYHFNGIFVNDITRTDSCHIRHAFMRAELFQFARQSDVQDNSFPLVPLVQVSS